MRSYHGCAVLEKVIAALVVAACVVMLVRLVLGSRARARLDAAVRRSWHRTGRWTREAFARPAAERRARRAADEAIRRASRGSWDGNVFRPDDFGRRRGDKKAADKPRRDLH